MKVLVIPDVHLKPWMFDRADEIVKEEKPDQIVCLGDIADDWGCQNKPEMYMETFDRAIRFSKDHPEMLWCIGNHDASYMWDLPESGMAEFDTKATATRCVLDLFHAIPEGHLGFVHRIDNVLFSHAGVSRMFVREQIGTAHYDDVDYVVQKINGLHAEQMWCNDSPIWLRPQKEFRHFPIQMYKPRKLFQVVGHSPLKEIEQEGNLLSCDVFSTYRDRSQYGSNEFTLFDTLTWKWKGIG